MYSSILGGALLGVFIGLWNLKPQRVRNDLILTIIRTLLLVTGVLLIAVK